MATSPLRARFWPYFRAAAAALTLAAVAAQLQRSIATAQEATTDYGSHVPTVVSNFLSFFTIQSNVLAAITLAIGAVWAWTAGRTAEREPRWYAVLLASASTYMIITGVVYNLLLRGIALPQGATVPWSNEVLHVVIPLVMLVDVLFAPKRRALAWPAALIALVYPLVWVVYTLVRGPLITAPATGNPWWYPYPFLDPNGPGGVGSVVVYVIGIALAIGLVAVGVVWVGRRRAGAATLNA